MKYLFLLLLPFPGLRMYAQPLIQVDSTKHNLGQIIQGTPLKYDIWVTNTGNEPLIITRVTTGDGGSMATYDNQPILPGKKGKVQFIYDTKRIGHFSRSLTIQSNDPEVHVINIKGEVVFDPMPISVSSEEIDLGSILYDSIADFSFRVSTAGKKPVRFGENRWAYYEYDLFNLESKCLDSISLLYGQNIGNEFEVKGQIINKYGNSGRFSHKIPFVYNSHDTLYITVKGTFVSKKPVVTHNEFVFREGTSRYIYENSCLKEVIHYKYGRVDKHYFFEGSNCVKMIELNTYPEAIYKTYKFVDGKPIKIENSKM